MNLFPSVSKELLMNREFLLLIFIKELILLKGSF